MTAYDGLRDRLARTLAGRYAVGELLGAGGMAAVFRAKDVALDRTVAIKVLPPDLSHDDKVVTRFEQEARIAAKLDHPNIIPIYRVESESGLNYFVMKFVPGRSLDAILEAGDRQDAQFTERVLLEAAAALGHAHQRGVVHRDVKPANIMLDADERVILTDFGISKAMENAAGLTKTGIIVGTPHYMAPEQAMGANVDGRADQYALACVGYHMLVGELPFPGDSAHSVLHRHIYEEPKPLAARRPDAPRAMTGAIARAMSKEPDDRYASMEEFAAALEGAPAGASAARSSGTPRRGVRRGARPPTVSVEAPTAPVGGRSATREYERRLARDRRWRIAGWAAAFLIAGTAGMAVARKGAPKAAAPDSIVARAESTPPMIRAVVDTSARRIDTAAARDSTVASAPSAPPKPKPAAAKFSRATPPAPAPAAEKASLSVDAKPFGTVYLNDKQIGDTPIIRWPLEVGRTYQLRIEHEGYKTYKSTITVTGPNEFHQSPTLEPLP